MFSNSTLTTWRRWRYNVFLTAACSFQLHLLHVDFTGRHSDGNGVNDGRVLQDGKTKKQTKFKKKRREDFAK